MYSIYRFKNDPSSKTAFSVRLDFVFLLLPFVTGAGFLDEAYDVTRYSDEVIEGAGKADILANNKLAGKAAEKAAKTDLISHFGSPNVYEQVSIRTNQGLRRMDFVVQHPSGKWVGYEVK